MKKFLFVVLIFVFIGCGYISFIPSDSGIHTNEKGAQMHWESVPIHVWYDGDLEEDVVKQSGLAIQHINSLVGTEIFLEPQRWPGIMAPDEAPHGTILLTKGYGIPKDYVSQSGDGCNVVARTLKDFKSETFHIYTATILFYKDGLKSEEYFALAIHELGHALGLAHDHDIFSIMNPEIRSAPLSKKHLTDKDISLLKEQYL